MEEGKLKVVNCPSNVCGPALTLCTSSRSAVAADRVLVEVLAEVWTLPAAQELAKKNLAFVAPGSPYLRAGFVELSGWVLSTGEDVSIDPGCVGLNGLQRKVRGVHAVGAGHLPGSTTRLQMRGVSLEQQFRSQVLWQTL